MDLNQVSKAINEAFDSGRVELTYHFWDELRADHFLLVDVRCALDNIIKIVPMGDDDLGNPKFEVTGPATDDRVLSVIGSFKSTGALLLITVYEVERL